MLRDLVPDLRAGYVVAADRALRGAADGTAVEFLSVFDKHGERAPSSQPDRGCGGFDHAPSRNGGYLSVASAKA